MELFLLEQPQHIPLLLPFFERPDVESLSSATRALAASALRDAFFRFARVVVPTCPRSNATVRGILARLSPLARHVAISEPSYLPLLQRLPVLSALRVAHRHDSDQDDDDTDRLVLSREAIASLHSLGGVVHLEVDAHVDDLAGLLAGMERLQSLDLVVRSQRALVDPIAGLPNLRSLVLRCGSVGDLRAIGEFSWLESLTLTSWAVHDVLVVGRLERLERLDLSSCNIVDLTPIASLCNLRCLKLEETPVEDLRPLAALARLQFLSLARSQASDLAPLGACAPSIRHLDLSGCTLTRVSSICYLQELESLRMYSTTWPSVGVEPSVTVVVSCLRNLRVLDGRIRPRFSQRPESVHSRVDLAMLLRTHHLEHLDLSGDSMSGIVPLVALPRLVSLRVEWGYTREPDVPLAALVHPRLRVLCLARMRLRRLDNLRYAPQLQELRLVDVLMEDLSTLRSAPNLTHFEHSCAMVRSNIVGDDELPCGRPPTLDLSALSALTKLRHLDLSFSSIRNLLPLRALANLRHVDLSNTDVEDVSPLSALPLLECIRLGDTEIAGFDGGAFCRVLRELVLPEHVDCRWVRAAAPLLRRLLHQERDCLWTGHAPP